MHVILIVGRRQTVLFSATLTRNVEDLAKLSLKKSPLYVGVDDNKETSTVEGLEQVKTRTAELVKIHLFCLCYCKGKFSLINLVLKLVIS